MLKKSVFTTGEAAKLLHVHQTTVIDWIDKGIMKSYKTPGGHRRIAREALLSFMQQHNMPLPNILSGEMQSMEEEKHRHLHEAFQVGLYPQQQPSLKSVKHRDIRTAAAKKRRPAKPHLQKK